MVDGGNRKWEIRNEKVKNATDVTGSSLKISAGFKFWTKRLTLTYAYDVKRIRMIIGFWDWKQTRWLDGSNKKKKKWGKK